MADQQIKNYVARQLSEQAKILRLSAYDREGTAYLKRYFYFRLDKHARNFLDTGGEPRVQEQPVVEQGGLAVSVQDGQHLGQDDAAGRREDFGLWRIGR